MLVYETCAEPEMNVYKTPLNINLWCLKPHPLHLSNKTGISFFLAGENNNLHFPRMKKMFSELQVQCEIVILMESYDKLLCLWFHYAIKCSLFFQICQRLLLN